MKKPLDLNPFDVMKANEDKDVLREYPLYPDGDDIYSKFKEEDLDPEDPSKTKTSTQDDENIDEADFDEDALDEDESGIDLDIPGSELDDDQELIGSEDEENNYYSIGGDDHNELDEDKDGFD
jgi:hypothetical protein